MMDYMMLWKHRFRKAEHIKDRADLFDAFYCDVDRKAWFFSLLELSRRVTEANVPKKKITDHIASVSDRLVAAMPPQTRTVETMTPAKYRLQVGYHDNQGVPNIAQTARKPNRLVTMATRWRVTICIKTRGADRYHRIYRIDSVSIMRPRPFFLFFSLAQREL